MQKGENKIKINIDLTVPDLAKAGKTLKKAVNSVKYDISAIRDRDPAATSDLEVLLFYSGLHAVMLHRVAHALHTKGHKLSARAISQGAKFLTGIEIHPGAKIGKGLVIDHGSGVVIGETAEVGDNCTLYQGVTLGGTGKHLGKRHPTLGNGVMVGSGAKVLGPFKVGDDAKIASNAVVLKEVPNGATAVGVPARVVRINGERIEDPLDHVHIPDPVAQEISRLWARINELSKELDGGTSDTPSALSEPLTYETEKFTNPTERMPFEDCKNQSEKANAPEDENL